MPYTCRGPPSLWWMLKRVHQNTRKLRQLPHSHRSARELTQANSVFVCVCVRVYMRVCMRTVWEILTWLAPIRTNKNVQCRWMLASSPGHSQLFNVARWKTRRPGLRSHVKCVIIGQKNWTWAAKTTNIRGSSETAYSSTSDWKKATVQLTSIIVRSCFCYF